MMGGAGSMQSMQTSLRNNRNLLKRKKRGFFKRDLSYAELKKYYKESSEPMSSEEKMNAKKIMSIRKQIIKRQRKVIVLQCLLTVVVLAIVSFGIYYLLNSSGVPEKTRQIETRNYQTFKKEENFVNNMALGELKMKSKDYFMAAGNFTKALELKPDDIHAEFNLAKAYCKMCKYRRQACKQADFWVDSMETKYPNQVSFTKLRKVYLLEN